MDPAIASILVAAVTTLGTIGAAFLAARSGKLGARFAQIEDSAIWKERFELEHAKSAAWEDRYQAEVEARRKAEARADFAERDADACARRLSDLYSELRATGRLVDRRAADREETG